MIKVAKVELKYVTSLHPQKLVKGVPPKDPAARGTAKKRYWH